MENLCSVFSERSLSLELLTVFIDFQLFLYFTHSNGELPQPFGFSDGFSEGCVDAPSNTLSQTKGKAGFRTCLSDCEERGWIAREAQDGVSVGGTADCRACPCPAPCPRVWVQTQRPGAELPALGGVGSSRRVGRGVLRPSLPCAPGFSPVLPGGLPPLTEGLSLAPSSKASRLQSGCWENCVPVRSSGTDLQVSSTRLLDEAAFQGKWLWGSVPLFLQAVSWGGSLLLRAS